MKARVHVTLKPGVLDPQGKAIHKALSGLGFEGEDTRFKRDVNAGFQGGRISRKAAMPLEPRLESRGAGARNLAAAPARDKTATRGFCRACHGRRIAAAAPVTPRDENGFRVGSRAIGKVASITRTSSNALNGLSRYGLTTRSLALQPNAL